MKKFLPIFVLITLSASAEIADATSEKKYPPYPDVWGVEFPDPGPNKVTIFGAWFASNGDVLLRTAYDKCVSGKSKEGGTLCEEGASYSRYEFFAQERHPISGEEFNTFGESFADPRLSNPIGSNKVQVAGKATTVLHDGSTIYKYGMSSTGCSAPFPGYYEVKDSNGTVVTRKSIFILLEKPISKSCRVEPDIYTISVDTITPPVLPLKDDTFLLTNIAGRYAIRFTKTFQTRFPYDRNRIFIVDTDVVDAARMRAKKRCGDDYWRCMDEEMRGSLGIEAK